MEIHPFCKECLKKHPRWKLFKDKVWMIDDAGNKRIQICNLIKEGINLSKSVKEQFSEDELGMIELLHDPLRWAQVEFKWAARWYQETMLKCSAYRKVNRIGRRAGKCLHEDEIVTLDDGSRVRVGDMCTVGIRNPTGILSYDQNTSNFVNNSVFFSENGVKEVFEIELDDGTILRRTGNHPLLTSEGWSNCSNILGKKVAVPLKVNRFGKEILDDDAIKIIAYMIGDGNTTQRNCRFSSASDTILHDLNMSLEPYGSKLKRYDCDGEYDYHIVRTGVDCKKYARDLLRDFDVMGKNSRNKRVPSQIMRSTRACVGLFLNRLFATDGWSTKRAIGYCSVNRDLVDDIFELLLRFGIRARRRTRNIKLDGKTFFASELNITDKDSIIKFADEINIFSKEFAVFKTVRRFKKHKYSDKKFDHYGREVWSNFKGKLRTILRKNYGLRPEYGPNKHVLNKALEDFNIDFNEFANKDIGWAQVKSVKSIGEHRTISLSVENTNTFITDTIEHNTETLCIKMVHYAYTTENTTSLVIAPYKNQVGLIFDRLDVLLSDSPGIKASIKRNTKNPYRLQFHNGSKILGFTSGTRTGSKSTGIRGQDAHAIFLDEADFLGDSDFEVILAILASRPDCHLWASSTPTGKREMYWRWCFPPGTKISMNDGSNINIENIRPGDVVVSADGRPDYVSKMFTRNNASGLYSIGLKCFLNQVSATKEHPFWGIKSGTQTPRYIRVEDIDADDYLGITIFKPDNRLLSRDIKYADKITEDRFNTSSYSYNANSFDLGFCNRLDRRKRKNLELAVSFVDKINKFIIENNGDKLKYLFRLLGYFLAEGSYLKSGNNGTHKAGIKFTFKNTEQKYINEVVILCEKFFEDQTVKLVDRSDRDSTIDVHVYGSWVYILFEYLCGVGSKNKKLHNDLFMNDFSVAALDTIIAGDGHTRNGVTEIGVISRELALQVHQMFLRKDVVASVKRISMSAKNDVYIVHEFKKSQKHTAFIKKGCFFSRVINKEFVNRNSIVYNFETELTHSYCANGFAVHNCTDGNLGFKEFHYPSSISPSWTKETEMLERSMYSDQGYAHEFDAEFGEEAEGVFLNKHIDPCIKKYTLGKISKNPDSIYTIGVDWNTSETGTHIVITEWNQELNHGNGAFKAVDKIIIGQTEFTQTKACEEIIELNEKWDPVAIYVDQGFGYAQIEMLHKYGLAHPKTGLVQKVKGINFGDRIEIRDPATRQRVKKHVKPFMVNLCVKRVEDGNVILPQSEDIKHGLVGQMRDYTVTRRTAIGQPIFRDEDDHTLIAWMLSIMAATMERSDMIRLNTVPHIAIGGKFGEKIDKDLIISRKKEQEKRENSAMVPRWPGVPQNLFSKETTLRATLDTQTDRQRITKRKNATISDLRRRRQGVGRKGRASY